MSFIALAMLACVDEDPFFDPSADTADHFQEDELQPVESGRRVSQARLRCSTRHVLGLSYQVVGEMRCMDPDSLIELPPGDGIDYVFSSVMPYFAPEAAERLREVAAVQPLEVVSGYRTVIQQHVIAAWYEYGTCTVKDAAEPGTSRHESGRAIDIRNYVEAEDTLGKHGWTPLAGDRGHYDFMAAPD
ncbi:MAG: M15 family metallopeptidase, partial [Deltaproteobacteria bacterium]|nr:M15 family metallopeptidase [Deltaproteobacteria bacterium]